MCSQPPTLNVLLTYCLITFPFSFHSHKRKLTLKWLNTGRMKSSNKKDFVQCSKAVFQLVHFLLCKSWMPWVNQRLSGRLFTNYFIISTVKIRQIIHYKQQHYLVYQADEICWYMLYWQKVTFVVRQWLNVNSHKESVVWLNNLKARFTYSLLS